MTGIKTGQMAEYLTATMAQFNMTAEESVSIVNKINEVDNNFAVTSQGLAQSIAKAGESAQQYGATLDDLIGYTTAIQTATKESGNVIGNSLKSVISRTFSDDSEKALAGIGIALKDVSGEARNVNQVWSDLAVKFKTLSQEQRQQIGLTIAGRYHLTRFLALMDNWSIATQATTTSQQSLFSALEENRKHLQSLESQINKVKTAGQEFSYTLGEQGLTSVMSGALQGVTLLLNGFTEMAKAGALGAVGLAALVLGITTITFKIAGSIPIITKFGLAIKEATIALATNPYFLAAVAIIGVVSAISMYIGKQKQLREEQEKVAKTVQESTKAFDELRTAMDEVGKPTLQNINDTEAQIKKYDQLIAKLSELQNQTDQIYIPDTGELIDVDKKYNPSELSQELKDLASNLGINIFQIKTWAEFLSLAKQKQDELNTSLIAGKKNSTEYQGEQIKNAQAQVDLANDTLGLVQEYKELNEVQDRNEKQNKRLIEVKNILLSMFPSETANGQIVVGLLETEAKKRLELAEAYMGQTREQLIANQKSTQIAYETAVKNIALYQAEISTLRELWAARANKQAAGVGDFRMLDNLSDLEYRLDQEKDKANSLAKTISGINNILNWKPGSVGGGSTGSSKSSGSSSSSSQKKMEVQQAMDEYWKYIQEYRDSHSELELKVKLHLISPEEQAKQLYDIKQKLVDDLTRAVPELNRQIDELQKQRNYIANNWNTLEKQFGNAEVNRAWSDANSQLNYAKGQLEQVNNDLKVQIPLLQKVKAEWERFANADTIIETYKKVYEEQKKIAVSAIDQQIDALDKQLSKEEEIINAKLKQLELDESKEDYAKKLAKEQKEAQDIQNQLNLWMRNDSLEGKAKSAELQKQLAEKQDAIAEMQLQHDRDLRKQNLQDQLTKAKEDTDAKKSALEQQKIDYQTFYDELLNDERSFAKLREDIISGNLTNVKNKLTEFAEEFAKINQEQALKLGESYQGLLNLLEQVNNSIGLVGGSKITVNASSPVKPASFDTGGLTGSWGKEGRLALLHQKELILNQLDTSKVLEAVKLARSFVPSFKLPDFSGFNFPSPAVAGVGKVEINFNIDKIQGNQSDAVSFATKTKNELAKLGIKL